MSRKIEARYPAHAEKHNPRPWLVPILATLLGVVLFVTTGFVYGSYRIQDNIDSHDINDLLDDRPTMDEEGNTLEPFKDGEPVNLLLLGSDVRNQDTAQADEFAITGMRSDTTMLMHVSADRTRVEVISIPRDLLVDIPACRLTDGTWTEYQQQKMFNHAFATGGEDGDVGAAAACTIRTVEKMTGLFIDGFAVVDFASFRTFVNVLGGVHMCFEEDMMDHASGLDLKKGCQTLDGDQALSLARARKNLGDGSDIGRMGRQQELVLAMIEKAMAKDLLTDLPSLYTFIDAVSQQVVVSSELGKIDTMASLGMSLKNVAPENIFMMTMPWAPAGPRVVPGDGAENLWQALKDDVDLRTVFNDDATLKETVTDEPSQPTDQPTGEPTETTTDSEISN